MGRVTKEQRQAYRKWIAGASRDDMLTLVAFVRAKADNDEKIRVLMMAKKTKPRPKPKPKPTGY